MRPNNRQRLPLIGHAIEASRPGFEMCAKATTADQVNLGSPSRLNCVHRRVRDVGARHEFQWKPSAL